MNIKSILNGVNYNGNIKDIAINNISYDSRRVTQGTLFVAIDGENFDGHDFIEEAIDKGAIAIIVKNGLENNYDALTVTVKNTRKTLSKISSNFYGNPSSKINVIGITGTNGKTTTTYLINKIFNDCKMKTGSIGTLGFISSSNFVSTGFTTPESLELNNFIDKLVKGGVKHVVLEVSSHALSLHRTDDIMTNIAVFTNLSNEHLDFHNNMESYFKEKLKLFTALDDNGLAIINIDDKYSNRILESINSNVITYGFDNKADIHPVSYQINYTGMSIELSLFNSIYKIDTKLTGKHNIYNIMASIAVGIENKIPLELMIKSINNIKSIPGRMEFIGNEKYKVFIDYAHTPDAYNNILKLVSDLKDENDKIITLFGCGGDRDPSKRPEMALISEKYSDMVIVTSDNPRNEDIEDIIKDIQSGFNLDNYLVIKDRELAIKHAMGILDSKSILMILGKGRENYQIENGEKTYHNDVEIVEKLINEI